MDERLTLRQLRIKARLDREELADLAGITKSEMIRAEIVNYQPVKRAIAEKILAALRERFEQNPAYASRMIIPEKPEDIKGLLLSKPIKWNELSNKDKTRLILEHVLKWRVFEDFDAYHSKLWEAGEYVEIEFPVAYWHKELEHWCVYSKEEEDTGIFAPLINLDDAWVVVKEMNKPVNHPDWPFPKYAPYIEFIHVLEKIVCSTMFFDLFYCDPDPESDDQHLTGDRICLAALIACGIEIDQ
jgi:transcriptional regulator with XRE-family HTH domain